MSFVRSIRLYVHYCEGSGLGIGWSGIDWYWEMGSRLVSGTLNRSNHDQNTLKKQTWLAAGPVGDIQERSVLAAKSAAPQSDSP